jgi:hypothetical protein
VPSRFTLQNLWRRKMIPVAAIIRAAPEQPL